MSKNKRNNLTKKDIALELKSKIGFSTSDSERFIEDLISSIISILKIDNSIKIKNFGSFKILNKKKRIGRNPKNRVKFVISPRKTVIFKNSKSLLEKIND